jgi:hypothetical protein
MDETLKLVSDGHLLYHKFLFIFPLYKLHHYNPNSLKLKVLIG